MKKLEIIKRSFRKLKLSGASSDPSIPQYPDGLMDLESMMAEWDKKPSVNTGYNSTGSNASLDEEAGITLGDLDAVSNNLAVRIAADYGIEVPLTVQRQAAAGLSDMVKRGATIPKPKYHDRIPKGQGNVYRGWYKSDGAFYTDQRNSSDAEQFNINDVIDYSVDFKGWLAGNSLASVTWEQEQNKIDITNVVFNTDTSSARLTFTNAGVHTVKITATDNLGQVTTESIDFAVNSV